MINDLIVFKLKETIQLQEIIESNELDYTSKRKKAYNLSKYALPIVFLREVYERKLTLQEFDSEQSKLVIELKVIDRS